MKFECHTLTRSVQFQVRRMRNVDATLLEGIKSICTASKGVVACLVLEARRPEVEGTWMAVVLDAVSAAEFELVAQRIGKVLSEFPDDGQKAVIMPMSRSLRERFKGSEIYGG